MKSRLRIFIFLVIICLEAKRISAFTFMHFNNIKIYFDGEDIRSKESFTRGYGKDLLTIGNLESNRIKNMKPHLTTVTAILPDDPLRTYFEYFLALCNDYPKLRELDAITKNIYNFVAESKGTLMNSFSMGGFIFSGNSLSTTGNGKMFVATSIQTDNEDEIKLDFEKHEEAMRKADEEREKIMARAAKMQEVMLKTAERQRKAALEWTEKLKGRIMGDVGEYMTQAMWMGGMAGMDGKNGTDMAGEPAKKSKERASNRRRDQKKDTAPSKKEFTEAPINRKKKPNRSFSDRGRILNKETFSRTDVMKGATVDLEDI